MPKLRKQRRRKRFRYDINRKRLRDRINSKGIIGCTEIKEAWEEKKSLKTNFQEMGLSHDPNSTMPILNKTKDFLDATLDTQKVIQKPQVIQDMLAEVKAPRKRVFRMPNGQVEWITYLMDKYGNDFKSMASDKKNYNQETWKQLRNKIKRFKNIPEQYSVYLKKSGKVPEENEDEEMRSDGEV